MAPRKNYTPEQMCRAIDAVVKSGETVGAAALKYGVPRITLRNKVTGKSPKVCAMGPTTILTAQEEHILVKWLFALADRHFPISRDKLLDSVQQIIINDNRKTPFTNNRPGKTWYQAFLKRNPEISERTAQNLTTSRDSVTEKQIRNWFLEIENFLEEKNLKNVLKDPKRIFNADESAFFLSPKSGRVLVRRGDKNVYTTSGNEKENLTVLLTANAAGQLAPPMVVFAYERVPKPISDSVPDTWGIGRSESGWMCSATFYEYITNVFHPWLTENKIELPVLFFLDGHGSHLTAHVSDFCANNGIEVVALYPNSTHIMQPMDVAVFRPLKVFWKKQVTKWKTENLGQQVTKTTFAPILKDALADVTKECISNGFRAGGIFPFGPEYIDFSKLNSKNRSTEVSKQQVVSSQSLQFFQTLESEIVQIFTDKKLDLFKKSFYLQRTDLEDQLPAEDIGLYTLWAKYKHMCHIEYLAEPELGSGTDATGQRTTTLYENTRSSTTSQSMSAAKDLRSSVININELETPQSSLRPIDNKSPVICESSNEMTKTVTFSAFDVESVNLETIRVEDMISTETLTAEHGMLPLNIDDSNDPLITASSSVESEVCESIGDTNKPIKITPHTFIMEPTESTRSSDLVNNSTQGSDLLDSVALNLHDHIAQAGPSHLHIEPTNQQYPQYRTPIKKSLNDVLHIAVPSPFKRSLFWPDEVEKKKYRKNKEKLPSAVTSKAWKQYHEKKELEKIHKQKERERKAKEREVRKLLKDKGNQNKRKRVKSKKTLKIETNVSSDETDTEIKYAESDDSYDVESDLILNTQPVKNVDLSGSESDEPICRKITQQKKMLKGNYVIVKYEGEFFPGIIVSVNKNTFEVSTMTYSVGNTFKWPEKPDKIWYHNNDIMEVIGDPILSNKRGFYTVKEMEKYLSFTV